MKNKMRRQSYELSICSTTGLGIATAVLITVLSHYKDMGKILIFLTNLVRALGNWNCIFFKRT